MPTPSELNKIKAAAASAVAALLARDSNAEMTAEELAEDIANEITEAMVESYEAIQAKSYNLVVMASFALSDGDVYTAAVGPLSTRAKQRARDVGARFAWDYRSRTGSGRFTLVPLIRDPAEAWDEARRAALVEFEHTLTSVVEPGAKPGYEPMRFELSEETRSRITAEWQMDPEILTRKFGPACLCGLTHLPERSALGHPVTPGCPHHPSKESGGRR